jgi:site-specific recombinase XerC
MKLFLSNLILFVLVGGGRMWSFGKRNLASHFYDCPYWVGAAQIATVNMVRIHHNEAAMIDRTAGNVRAIQMLLGHSTIENMVRYLGVDVEGALLFSEKTKI